MQEHQVATADAYNSYLVYFLHYYSAEYEYTIQPTIQVEQNIRYSPNTIISQITTRAFTRDHTSETS